MARARNQPSQPRNDTGWHDDDWLQPLPTPDVQEGCDSLWDTWHQESRRMDLAFADTQPSDLIPLTDGSPVTEPREEERLGNRWTADDLMVMCRRNNRVCPRPLLWTGLYLLLEGDRYADLRPPPTQSWMWGTLSNLQRRLQFREQVEWAEQHGKLAAMATYLASLAEADWVHMGEN